MTRVNITPIHNKFTQAFLSKCFGTSEDINTIWKSQTQTLFCEKIYFDLPEVKDYRLNSENKVPFRVKVTLVCSGLDYVCRLHFPNFIQVKYLSRVGSIEKEHRATHSIIVNGNYTPEKAAKIAAKRYKKLLDKHIKEIHEVPRHKRNIFFRRG